METKRFDVIHPKQTRPGTRVVLAFEITLEETQEVPNRPWRVEFAAVHGVGDREVRACNHHSELVEAERVFNQLVEKCRKNPSVQEQII